MRSRLFSEEERCPFRMAIQPFSFFSSSWQWRIPTARWTTAAARTPPRLARAHHDFETIYETELQSTPLRPAAGSDNIARFAASMPPGGILAAPGAPATPGTRADQGFAFGSARPNPLALCCVAASVLSGMNMSIFQSPRTHRGKRTEEEKKIEPLFLEQFRVKGDLSFTLTVYGVNNVDAFELVQSETSPGVRTLCPSVGQGRVFAEHLLERQEHAVESAS
eukprot:m.919176 g.919176  ORF g.919176 m.919176 type:complete len:222 (+) comp60186_c0_seq2:1536-2201(+)